MLIRNRLLTEAYELAAPTPAGMRALTLTVSRDEMDRLMDELHVVERATRTIGPPETILLPVPNLPVDYWPTVREVDRS